VTVMALHRDILFAGSAWMAAGITIYVLYRRTTGLPLLETTMIDEPRSPEVVPVGYATVLVAFEEDGFSGPALATALKLASHRRGDVRVLVTLEVPHHLDLDAHLGEQERIASEIVEAARQWAQRGQRVHGGFVKVRPGEAGGRIVEEALRTHADAIVMPMPRRRAPGRLLGKTLEVVLSKRPCRVVIDSQAAQPFEQGREAGEPDRELSPSASARARSLFAANSRPSREPGS
jgi:APA family basic amino acid/polyamine antiporter